MKKKLLLMLLVVGLMAGAAQANMLVNPGFEEGTFESGTPDYWAHFYTNSDPQHVWVDSAAGAHSGDRFMKMYNWLPTSASSAWLGQEVLGVVEGYEYLFGVWAKTATAGLTKTAGIYVDWYSTSSILTSSAAGWIDWEIVTVPVTSDTWTEVDFGALTAPEGTIAAVFWLAAFTDNGIDAIYYDDANMISLGLAPEPNFVIDAGVDMITWSDQAVQLDPTVVNNNDPNGPQATLSYAWSADPDEGVVISDANALAPTVTITKATLNPSIVTLTFEVSDGVDLLEDIMKINVYDDACMATIAAGLGWDKSTDIVVNCKTDLEDFAAFALTWAKFAEGATEPFPRP